MITAKRSAELASSSTRRTNGRLFRYMRGSNVDSTITKQTMHTFAIKRRLLSHNPSHRSADKHLDLSRHTLAQTEYVAFSKHISGMHACKAHQLSPTHGDICVSRREHAHLSTIALILADDGNLARMCNNCSPRFSPAPVHVPQAHNPETAHTQKHNEATT